MRDPEKILKEIKGAKLYQLRRNTGLFQAFMVSFIVSLFVGLFQFISEAANGNYFGPGIFIYMILIGFLIVFMGFMYSKEVLLVELKEERVHKMRKDKAIKFIIKTIEETEGVSGDDK